MFKKKIKIGPQFSSGVFLCLFVLLRMNLFVSEDY